MIAIQRGEDEPELPGAARPDLQAPAIEALGLDLVEAMLDQLPGAVFFALLARHPLVRLEREGHAALGRIDAVGLCHDQVVEGRLGALDGRQQRILERTPGLHLCRGRRSRRWRAG